MSVKSQYFKCLRLFEKMAKTTLANSDGIGAVGRKQGWSTLLSCAIAEKGSSFVLVRSTQVRERRIYLCGLYREYLVTIWSELN